MIEHVNSKTLFTGDNVFNNRFGRFDESSSILSNFEIIEYAKKLNLDVFVPGHGKTGSFDVAVAPWSEYLTVLIEESKKGYEDDLMDYEVKPFVLKRIKNMEGWDGYDGIGAHVNKVLREIEDLD
jgi:glyoxylase-like metal-dependent hydrolase (beta-lactamase superfamily II)